MTSRWGQVFLALHLATMAGLAGACGQSSGSDSPATISLDGSAGPEQRTVQVAQAVDGDRTAATSTAGVDESRVVNLERRVSELEKRIVELEKSQRALAERQPVASSPQKPDREAILTFTRKALEIEDQRYELLSLRHRYSDSTANKVFSGGSSTGPIRLPSAYSLMSNMSLLKAPDELQYVENGLVEAYRLEIEAFNLENAEKVADELRNPNRLGTRTGQEFIARIDRFNVDSDEPAAKYRGYANLQGPWVAAQRLRKDAYAAWLEVLREVGIDPDKEGITAWTIQPPNPWAPRTPTPQP